MSTAYRRSDDAIFATVGHDIVALHIPKGRCYGMEDVSAAVWNLLAEPRTPEDICAQLIEDYDVEPGECRADVEQLLKLFRSEGLIEEAPPSSEPAA